VINVKLELGEPDPNKFYIQVMAKPITVAEVPKANVQSLKQLRFVFLDQRERSSQPSILKFRDSLSCPYYYFLNLFQLPLTSYIFDANCPDFSQIKGSNYRIDDALTM